MEDDTACDERRRRHAGQQPPWHRSAVIGITTPADDVKGRLIRHNANVPARPWFSYYQFQLMASIDHMRLRRGPGRRPLDSVWQDVVV